MPDVVRLRNNHGHLVEVDHVPGPNPEHGDVIDVPGALITDEASYRMLMGLPAGPDEAGYAPLPPDVAGYHWVLGVDEQLRGWPKEKWDLVTEANTKAKAKGK